MNFDISRMLFEGEQVGSVELPELRGERRANVKSRRGEGSILNSNEAMRFDLE
jgi:hypothetical protein